MLKNCIPLVTLVLLLAKPIGAQLNDFTTNWVTWSAPQGYQPGVAAVTAQQVTMTSVVGQNLTGIYTPCSISGDFDVQVDFELLNWPAGNGYALAFGAFQPTSAGEYFVIDVQSSSQFGEQYAFLSNRFTGIAPGGFTLPTNDTFGKLRLIRTGSSVRFYIYSEFGNAAWGVPAGTWFPVSPQIVLFPPVTSSGAPLTFSLGLYTSLTTNGAAGVDGAFANFQVNAGTISCPATGGPGLPDRAAALAKGLVGFPYGYGGKGFDFQEKSYANQQQIASGYKYYLSDCQTDQQLGLLTAPGVDCSGLVMWSYNMAAGATTQFWQGDPIAYPGANSQYLWNTRDIGQADLHPGDLLFFNYAHLSDPITGQPKMADHVAMYVGGTDVVEAYTCDPRFPTGQFVIRSNINARPNTDPVTSQNLPVCSPGLTKPCFVGFRRVTSPTVMLAFVPLPDAPITLAVSDPDGLTITASDFMFTEREVLREIADRLYYNDADAVISPVLKTGAYFINAFPKPQTQPTDTYSLLVKTGNGTMTLAQNVPISDIPREGYAIRSANGQVAELEPFSKFRVRGEIESEQRQKFELEGHFTLGSRSLGIDPTTEDVMIQVGTFLLDIPSGSFVQRRGGAFEFEGVINSVSVEMTIDPLSEKRFVFKAEVRNANFSGLSKPVNVVLTVGNDGGRAFLVTDSD